MTIAEPIFSVLVLAYGPQAYLLSLTMDNLASQTFSDFEVLIADGRKEKKEIPMEEAKIVKVPADMQPREMTRILLEKAKGRYVHVLVAGEYYIGTRCLQWMADALAAEGFPELMCTGFIRHHSLSPTEFLYYPLSKKGLLQGNMPSLSACFWQRKTLIEFAGQETHGDLLCRFVETGKKAASLNRVLVDYIYQVPTPKRAIVNVVEAGKVLLRNFGPRPSILFWAARIACHFVRWWVARVKKMFHPIAS